MYALEMRELTVVSIVLRILVAILAGGIIGLERGMKNRAAGFRTYILVCLGACMVMMTNQYVYQALGTGDPVRMGAQVISGIGFLGAGTIIVTSRSQIKGLTTAAGLWCAACVGLAAGMGFYEIVLSGGVCIVLVLTIFHSWEDFMRRKTKVLTLYIELVSGQHMRDFLQSIRAFEINVTNVQIETGEAAEEGCVCFVATVKSKRKMKKEVLLQDLKEIPCIQYLEEL